MKATVEREIKLGIADGAEPPRLPGSPLPVRHFVSTYWDTADRDLASCSITLRHRIEHGRGRWQLKIPHDTARLELEADGGPVHVPDELAGLLVALTRNGPLERAAVLATRRSGALVTTGGGAPVAEIVVDEVSVQDGNWSVGRFAEIEVELLEAGRERDLDRLERLLRDAGATDGDDRPKLLQVLDVSARDAGGPRLAAGTTADRDASPGAGMPADLDGGAAGDPAAGALAATRARLGAALDAQHRTMLSCDPGTRLGRDPEALHDMRVATRRIRSYLRVARDLLDPAWALPLRVELGWLADVLGAVRDLDVQLERLGPELATLEPEEAAALEPALIGRLHAERDAARARLLVALCSPRYLRLLDRLAEPVGFAATAGGDAPRAEAADASAPTLEALAAAELRRLRKVMRRLDPASPDEELHAARIRGKRARYASELALGAAAKASPLVARVKALQDVLGEHQDAVVAEECIRRHVRRARAAAAIGAGRLIERERTRKQAARSMLPATWKALDKASRKAFR